ncbi:MAG: LysM peptidoglycan-binding domain-containing protein [Bdellovibrionales bacterium]|nr:LysM peptidoglycan-binding domain-containing protein [Bdellovibrionales bacterium]
MRAILLLSFIFLASCSHKMKTNDSRQQALLPSAAPIQPYGQEDVQIEAEQVQAQAPVVTTSENDLNDNETDMKNLPLELNAKVTKWTEYFQGRGREHMKRYLSRSSRYLPKMKEILKKHGLPEDLVYIALIESGFNAKAVSSARAVGFWQFIRGTGRRYGLTQNYYVDERRDFVLATEGAAKYLKALYNLFGSWYLAIASYNVGENRVKNLVMKYYTRNFWDLAKKGRLPRETQNYVPKFLAARLIAKHPEKYGFDDVVYEPPLDFKEVDLSGKGVNLKKLAKHLNVTYSVLSGLNPAYKRGVIPKRRGGTSVRVPTYMDDKTIIAALQKSKSSVNMKVIASGSGHTHRIRRGDTLSHIAQRYGTSIQAIREANNLSRRSTLYPGKKLIIPTGRKIASRSRSVASTAGEKTYRVRRGDNLYSIAKRFGVTISQIRQRNKLGRRSLLKVGKVLVIPGRGARRARKTHHVVRRGESLLKIAKKYNVTLTQLTKANRMSRRSRLLIGKRLVIPQ